MKRTIIASGPCCLALLLGACSAGDSNSTSNVQPVEDMSADDVDLTRRLLTAEDAGLAAVNLALDGVDRATSATATAAKRLQPGSLANPASGSLNMVIDPKTVDLDNDGDDDHTVWGSGSTISLTDTTGTSGNGSIDYEIVVDCFDEATVGSDGLTTTLASGAQLTTDLDIDLAWTSTTSSGNYSHRHTLSSYRLDWVIDGQPTTCLLDGSMSMIASNIQLSNSPSPLSKAYPGAYDMELRGQVIVDGESLGLVIVAVGTFTYDGSDMTTTSATYHVRIADRTYGPFERGDLIAAPTAVQ